VTGLSQKVTATEEVTGPLQRVTATEGVIKESPAFKQPLIITLSHHFFSSPLLITF
jgi:hypothetical protein